MVRSKADERARDRVGAPPSAWWWIAPLLALSALFIVSLFLDTTTELTPDHSDAVAGVALLAGLAAGVVAVGLMLVFRPATNARPLPSALGLGLIAMLVVFLDTMSLGEVIADRADFATGPVVRWRGTVPITRARVTHGKGSHYYVRLSPWGVDMSVSQSAYRASFGTADDVQPRGWCLRATLERDGPALRIMHGSMTTMPDDSLVPCPDSG